MIAAVQRLLLAVVLALLGAAPAQAAVTVAYGVDTGLTVEGTDAPEGVTVRSCPAPATRSSRTTRWSPAAAVRRPARR